MTRLISFFISFFLIVFSQQVNAGRLGTCVRCVTDSGIESHIWTGPINILGACGGLNNGGDGDPRQCDAQAGVFRHPNGDPFWRCDSHTRSNHFVWIGGENLDLVALGNDRGSIQTATLFRIQDGEEYECGKDLLSGANFTALLYGNHRDLLDIFIRNQDGSFSRNSFRYQDGRNHVLRVGHRYVALLIGNHKDIIVAHGIRSNGEISTSDHFWNDGRHHQITPLNDTDFGLTIGRNDDIRVRYCFSGSRWNYGGSLGVGANFPGSCSTVAP